MSIEFRKEYFADERDDNLNEVGKPTQRQDALGILLGGGWEAVKVLGLDGHLEELLVGV